MTRSTPTPLRSSAKSEHCFRLRELRREEWIDIELVANEGIRSSLEKTGLPELNPELLFGEDRGGLYEIVDAKRIEDDSGPKFHLKVAKTPEEITALPASEEMDIRLGGVELEAASQTNSAEPRRLGLDANGDDA